MTVAARSTLLPMRGDTHEDAVHMPHLTLRIMKRS